MIRQRHDTHPLELRGLTVAYADVPVLWNISWAATPGRRIAVVGPNGAGKTTLLEAALGLVPVLAGEARFFGQPLAQVRDRVAYVPQRESVDWDFPVTAIEVVAMGLVAHGASGSSAGKRAGLQGGLRWPRWFGNTPREHARRAMGALDDVGLADLASRPIGQLSGGQQQRVFLARALARDADLLVLDEPFAGVDTTTEQLLLAHFARLAEEGRTVIAVHHDLDAVRAHFDEALVVNRELIAAGPVSEVLAPEVLARAYGAPLHESSPQVDHSPAGAR